MKPLCEKLANFFKPDFQATIQEKQEIAFK
jgi:hypothetical protein